MLIHPWDEAGEVQWREVLAHTDFGLLIAAGRNRDYPVVVPTHFVVQGSQVLIHLAKPNPVWAAIAENAHVMVALTQDWTYVEAAWNSPDDPTHGVPTSYYTAIHLHCTAEILGESDQIAELLTNQVAHFEPDDTARVPVSVNYESDRRQMKAIRGLRLQIIEVRVKQKYGGNRSVEHRLAIADHLAERGAVGDEAARRHVLRRTPNSPTMQQ